MIPTVKRELEAFVVAGNDDERAERVEAIRALLCRPEPDPEPDPDFEAVRRAGEILETNPDEAERIIRAHFGPPEPKRLAPLPFGESEPVPVLWRDDSGGWADAVLSAGEVAVLSATGGTGKSTLTLQVAIAGAAAPADGYGEACGLRVRSGPVVFVSYEDSAVRMAARVRGIAGSGRDTDRILYWPDPGPLYIGFEGGREQGPGPAREAKAAGCGVLIVAHDTKAARNAVKEGDTPGAGAVAGSATWFDAPRGVLYLSRKGDDGARELQCIKANYGRSGWAVNLAEKFDGGGRFVGFEDTDAKAKAAAYAKETGGGYNKPPPR